MKQKQLKFGSVVNPESDSFFDKSNEVAESFFNENLQIGDHSSDVINKIWNIVEPILQQK